VAEVAFIKESGDGLFIRVQGHITAQLCPELKAVIFQRLEKAPPPAAIYMDLAGTEYMDSTFLGFIVGLNKKYRALTQKKLCLVHVNETCTGLLRTIGVLNLIDIQEDSPEFPRIMDRIEPGPRATAEFLLDAHEELADLSDENRARFSTLTDALRSALGRDKRN